MPPSWIRTLRTSFINAHALESMKRVGAVSAICERHTLPRSSGGVGKSLPLQTSATVRLSVQFVYDDQPTASLAVLAYIGLSKTIQHDVLLVRDSQMRFHDHSYRTLAPRPGNNLVLREFTLPLPRLQGTTTFIPDISVHHERFHLLYAGDPGITLCRGHRFVDVDLFAVTVPPPLPVATL